MSHDTDAAGAALQASLNAFVAELTGQAADLRTLVPCIGQSPAAFIGVEKDVTSLEQRVAAVKQFIDRETSSVQELERICAAAAAQVEAAAMLTAQAQAAGIDVAVHDTSAPPVAAPPGVPPRSTSGQPLPGQQRGKRAVPPLRRSKSQPAQMAKRQPPSPARTRRTGANKSSHPGTASKTRPSSRGKAAAPSSRGPGAGGPSEAGASGNGRRKPVPRIEPLSQEELNSVPKYQRGRLTFDKLSAALEDINGILSHKYQLLSKPMSKLWGPDLSLYQTYKAQVTKEVKGTPFFCAADVKGLKSLKGSTGTSVLQVLRHMKRLKVVSGGGHTRYLVQV